MYDVIIVGTGAAGLFTALCLPHNLKVLMITKANALDSDSYLAQGGISTLLDQTDFDSYFEDTMKAGRYKNDKTAVKAMIEESKDIIKELINLGIDFDQNSEGKLDYTREGGHSTFRILHHQDVTGKEIVTKLYENVKNTNNIEIKENVTMVDIIEENGICNGIIINDNNEIKAVYSKNVVLATGGLGGLFIHSTNFPHIKGDSFAIALRHNIELENINYIQIHPTVLYSTKKERNFLISESVRGEGAILLNEEKERFVDELLPRDVVTEAIVKEMNKFNTKYVYLSFENINKEEIVKHFPNIYNRCLMEGYDVMKELIPVTPAQHYLMGGIKASIYGETSMKNLFAVGETACNGVHGANRLASNSLLESLVFSRNTANNIKDNYLNKTVEEKVIDIDSYKDMDKWNLSNKEIILEEIKRKDGDFYDKWCNFKN